MKKLLILILAFMPLLAVSQLRPYCGMSVIFDNCNVRKPGNTKDVWHLSGKVRVVKDANEDATFNIFATKGGADMVVFVAKDKKTFFDCGVWRWVNNDEDFSVRFVDSPDDAHFSVRFVESLSDGHGCHVCDN